MAVPEDFQGFVPVSLFLPSQRVDGKVWKFKAHRVLQHIEEDSRRFLPVVEAKVYALGDGPPTLTGEFDVLAVNKSAILAIEPKDTVTPVYPRE